VYQIYQSSFNTAIGGGLSYWGSAKTGPHNKAGFKARSLGIKALERFDKD